MEKWVTIQNYENYEVSNYGRIRNKISGYVTYGRKSGGRKYYTFTFPDRKEIGVHRLVAQYFCDGYFEGAIAHHIDHDTFNNHYTNLKWITLKENNHRENSFAPIKSRELKRKEVYQLSLDNKIIKEFKAVRDTEKEGYNHRCVSDCCNKKRKTHRGYKWVFKEEYFDEIC